MTASRDLLISVYSLVKKCAPALLATALLAAPARADRTLALDEALALAKQNNRDLKAARESIAQVGVVIEQARAQLLPTVSAQGKYTFNYPAAQLDPATFTRATDLLAATLLQAPANAAQTQALNAFRTGLAAQSGKPITIIKQNQLDFAATASIPLLVPGAYPAYQGALAQRRAAEANFAVTQTSLLLGAAVGFYSCAGADELVQARKHAIDVADQTVKNAQARLDAGTVNRVEVSRAELAYVQTVQRLSEAKDTQAQTYRALATLLQLREPFVVKPIQGDEAEHAVDELQKQALELRPEFRAYETNIEAQKKSILSGWLRWAPVLSGFGRFAAGNYSGFSGKRYSASVGLEADWALYDGGLRDASRHQAESLKRQYALQLAQLHDTINDDIAQADRALRTKREALQTAQKSVSLSTETLALIRAQHDAGTATQLDLLQAQDALVTAEVGLAQSRFDLATSQIQLDRLSGAFGPGGVRK
ncbi:MAG: TolC family protein [Polyangia bacterium]